MKVVCESCQAKYQIPDERVAGRRLKIRCRKCGDAILIHGEYLTEQVLTAEADAADESSLGEWHVSVDGEQHGPYPLPQTVEMLRGHQLAWDAYVWREGYDEWKMAGDSDTLVHGVALAVSHDAETTAAPAPQSDDDSPTRMVQASVILDPALRATHGPASQAPQANASLRASSPNVVSGSGLPQQGASNGSGFSPAATAAVHGPRVTASASLAGERHEDSVLFAARNLTVDAGPVRPQTRAGYVGGEGSGLIDIRALSALARSNSVSPGAQRGSAENKPARSPFGGEATLELQRPPASLFGGYDSLSPMARPKRARSNALPIAIVAGSAMIAAAAFLAVYITRGQPASAGMPPAAVVAVAQPAVVAVAQPIVGATPSQPPTALPSEAAADLPVEAVPSASATTLAAVTAKPSQPATLPSAPALSPKTERAARKSAKSTNRSSAPSAADETATQIASANADPPTSDDPAPAGASIDDLLLEDKKPAGAAQPAGAPLKPTVATGPRSIDDLLDTAVAPDAKKPTSAAPAVDSALPESPSRDQVLSAMRALESDVLGCAKGATLVEPSAKVSITVIGATGRVSSARVTGIQGPVGSCIARVVRGANFAKFSKPQFAFEFPFKLK